jgi:hypothetical protein
MKTYWGKRSIAPRILDLGTRWRWVVSFTPRPLYPQGKRLRYPLDMRLGGPQSRSGHDGEETIPSPRWESNPKTPIVQPVAQRYTDWDITTALLWLNHPNNIWWSVQVMKLLIMQSSPASRHFLPVRSKYSPQLPVLNIFNLCFSLSVKDKVSDPSKTKDKTKFCIF